jgi:hypothetical protein
MFAKWESSSLRLKRERRLTMSENMLERRILVLVQEAEENVVIHHSYSSRITLKLGRESWVIHVLTENLNGI